MHFRTHRLTSNNSPASLLILIAGPYRSGTGDDPAMLAENVRVMEAYDAPALPAGHVPLSASGSALPLVALAGSQRVGDAVSMQSSTRLPSDSSRAVTQCFASAGRRRARTLWCEVGA